jgi:hypothetical protein
MTENEETLAVIIIIAVLAIFSVGVTMIPHAQVVL